MRHATPLLVLALAVASVYALAHALTGGAQAVPAGVQTALAVLWAFLPLVVCYALATWLLAVLWLWLLRSLR